MKQFYYRSERLFTLLTLFAAFALGTQQSKAETVIEGFEEWGKSIADGWLLINGATYGNSYSYDYVVGSEDYTPATGTKCLANSGHSAAQGTTSSPMIVTPALSGTVAFKFRKYNSSSSTKGYINVFEYDESTGTATGSSIWTCRPNGVEEATSKYQTGSIAVGDTPKRLAFYLAKVSIDDFTYTPAAAAVEGAAMAISGYKDGETFDFGMVNPGASQTLTVTNPGTAEVNITITTTGGYTASPTSLTIAAKGKSQLTVTVPEASADGTLTLTAQEGGVAPITLKLSCMVKDPAKLYEDFSGNALPDDWETQGIGSYTTGDYASSYVWDFSQGYAAYKFSAQNESYATNFFHSLITPRLTFTDGEKLLFKVKKNVQFSSYIGVLYVEYSADKKSWTQATGGYFAAEAITNEWQDAAVTIPASAKYVRFRGVGIAIDEVYGGEVSTIPMPKLAVDDYTSGGTLSWGFADVPAGTEKTLTLRNTGKAQLHVAIAATNDFTVSASEATIEAGESFVLTIGTPAHDGNGKLTITPDAETGLEAFTLTLTSYYKVPKAVMALDQTAIAFGKCYSDKTETVTVSNTGDATLTAGIASSDAARFVVNPSSLTVEPGQTATFDITFKHDDLTSGTFTANINITPNHGNMQTIRVTATNKREGVWSEDFEEGIPATWTNDGWTIGRKWNEENSVNHACTNGKGYLVTPRLKATEGEELTFEFVSNYAEMKVEYSTDGAEWTLFNTFTTDSVIAFKAPAAASYYLRFSGSGSYLDNFEGFQLDLLDADIAVTASTLPATATQFVAYNAAVTIENKGQKAQTVVAQLFVGDELKDTQEAPLAIDGKASLSLTFTPETAVESTTARIEVTLKGVTDFAAKTVEQTISIAAAPTLDENEASILAEQTLPALILKYTAVNGWNTICMPFQLTADVLDTLFGEGWEAYELSGYEDNLLKMKKTTTFVAGYPYLVNAKNAPAAAEGHVLKDITIARLSAQYDYRSGATFQGSYQPMSAGSMTDCYAIGSDLTVAKGTEEQTLAGYRAYLTLPEGAKTPTIQLLDENGQTTGVKDVKRKSTDDNRYYNLGGQRVTKPAKGLYIHNGKKVIKI